MTGRSQAVRLPKEYRVTGDSVYVKRLGNSIVLIPKTADRWAGLFAALDEFPRDFALERRQDQVPRAGLDKLFDKATEKRCLPARHHAVDRFAAHEFPLHPPEAFSAQPERYRSFDHHGVRAAVWPRTQGSQASAPARPGTATALCHPYSL